jgi:3-isopropylmalate dehydrogenase
MLETLGEQKGAELIEGAVVKVLRDDIAEVAAGKMGHSTTEVGDLIVDAVRNSAG